MKRKHFTLPPKYEAEMERLAVEAHLPEGRWVAIQIMNAIDDGRPATRVRNKQGQS